MMDDIKLHYNSEDNRWRRIPRGTWVQDSGHWVRRAVDDHIYDIVINEEGQVFFWKDYDGWYPVHDAVYPDLEEAKAVAAVLLRLHPTTE